MGYKEIIESIPGLVAYMPLDNAHRAKDVVNNVEGKVHGNVTFDAHGAHFDGKSWIEFPDSPHFSPATSKEFTQVHFVTISDWHRESRNGEYVHYMGKGSANHHEWTCRYYIDGGGGEAAARKRRTSFYSFNPDGGLGAGSYTQHAEDLHNERMMAGQINAKGNGRYPGWTKQWRNAKQEDQDMLAGYDVIPRRTTAPLGIGSRGDNTGFLVGTMRRVAFFDRILTESELKTLWDARDQPETSGTHHAPAPDTHTAPAAGTGDHVVVVNGKHRLIDGVDRARKADELIAYTPKTGASTGTNEHGTEVVVEDGLVTAVRSGRGDTHIPPNRVVLSGHGASRTWLNDNAHVGAHVVLPPALAPAPPPPPNPDIAVLRGLEDALRNAKSRTGAEGDKAINEAAAVLGAAATKLEHGS